VVKWPKEEYGNFYTGDSYIVLKTTADPDSGKLLWDVHFWLGTETTTDEMGTAAYKTVELDDLKDGAPIQHREVQGHESGEFRAMFGQINYLEGGVESGFNKVEPDAYLAKLLMVRKDGGLIRVTQIPLARASLNQGDCFILDAGRKIYTWFGDSSSPFEKNKCNLVAQNMSGERLGKATVVAAEDDAAAFWELLGGEGEIASAERGNSLQHSQSLDMSSIALYRLSDETGELVFNEVARGEINAGMLDSSDVFILDDTEELFVWVGAGASDAERRKAMETAQKYLESMSKPMHTPISMYREGQTIRNATWKRIMG